MKTYRITVNGTAYDVVVEEVENGAAPAPVQAPVAKPVAAPAPAKKPAQAVTGTKIISPMPGKILDVKVAAGASVKRGQVVMILEAMKMENEIVAPEDGVIADIIVAAGTSVEAGDVLASMN